MGLLKGHENEWLCNLCELCGSRKDAKNRKARKVKERKVPGKRIRWSQAIHWQAAVEQKEVYV